MFERIREIINENIERAKDTQIEECIKKIAKLKSKNSMLTQQIKQINNKEHNHYESDHKQVQGIDMVYASSSYNDPELKESITMSNDDYSDEINIFHGFKYDLNEDMIKTTNPKHYTQDLTQDLNLNVIKTATKHFNATQGNERNDNYDQQLKKIDKKNRLELELAQLQDEFRAEVQEKT